MDSPPLREAGDRGCRPRARRCGRGRAADLRAGADPDRARRRPAPRGDRRGGHVDGERSGGRPGALQRAGAAHPARDPGRRRPGCRGGAARGPHPHPAGDAPRAPPGRDARLHRRAGDLAPARGSAPRERAADGGVHRRHGPRRGLRAVAGRGAPGPRGRGTHLRGLPAGPRRRAGLPCGGEQPGSELRRLGDRGLAGAGGRPDDGRAGADLAGPGVSRRSTTRTRAASPRRPRASSRATASRRSKGCGTSSPWSRRTTRGP